MLPLPSLNTLLPDTSDCCKIHPQFFIGHLFKFLNKFQTLFPLLEKQRVPLHTRQFEESVRKAFFKSILNNVLIDEVLPESRTQTSPERKQRSIFELFSVVLFNLLQGFQLSFPYGTGEPIHCRFMAILLREKIHSR